MTLLAGATALAGDAAWVDRARYLMGTRCEIRAFGPPEPTAAALDRALDRIAALERVMTTWDPAGELARVNDQLEGQQRGQVVEVSTDLARALAVALYWQRRTEGAFDPSLGSLAQAWGLQSGGRIPAAAERDALRPDGRKPRYTVDPLSRRLETRRGGLRFDLGGIGKGFALDEAAALLREAGVRHALFNFGGQVLALGPPPGADAWVVELAHPEDRARPLATLPLARGSIATSGGSERALRVRDRHFSHLLDPRTGSALEPRGTVVVAATTATAADALSTALAVAGAVEGARFLGPGASALWMTPSPRSRPAVRSEEN